MNAKQEMLNYLRENENNSLTQVEMMEKFGVTRQTASNNWAKDPMLKLVPGSYPKRYKFNFTLFNTRHIEEESPQETNVVPFKTVNSQYRDAANEIRAEKAPTAVKQSATRESKKTPVGKQKLEPEISARALEYTLYRMFYTNGFSYTSLREGQGYTSESKPLAEATISEILFSFGRKAGDFQTANGKGIATVGELIEIAKPLNDVLKIIKDLAAHNSLATIDQAIPHSFPGGSFEDYKEWAENGRRKEQA